MRWRRRGRVLTLRQINRRMPALLTDYKTMFSRYREVYDWELGDYAGGILWSNGWSLKRIRKYARQHKLPLRWYLSDSIGK